MDLILLMPFQTVLVFSDGFLIRFMNDASSFAVGEAWAGSASKFNRSLSITLGTGFGSAFISNRIPIVDGPEVPKTGLYLSSSL